MTSDTFVTSVKSVTTPAIRGGEGWVMEAVCRWLNKAGQSPLCTPAAWWCSVRYIHVLHSPFPAEEWASTYRKQVLVVPGRTAIGRRWNSAPENMDESTVQDHGLPLLNTEDRPAVWLVYTQGNCGRSRMWQTSHSCICWNFKILWQVCRKGIKLPLIPCHIRIPAVPDYQHEEPVISRLYTHTTPNLSLFILY